MNLAEDIFLNIGGIFAFLVAFVPTGGGSGACQDPDTRVSASVHDNITALLIVGIVAIVVAFTLLAIGWNGLEKAHRWWALAEGIIALALWAGTLIATKFYLSWALGHVHYIAAISLAACIIAVAGANAYRRNETPSRGSLPKTGTRANPARFLYTWIAVGMLVISVLLLVLAVTGVITVYWVEISVAAMFAIFWTAQTIQLELESAGSLYALADFREVPEEQRLVHAALLQLAKVHALVLRMRLAFRVVNPCQQHGHVWIGLGEGSDQREGAAASGLDRWAAPGIGAGAAECVEGRA
jgi:hypothetical protein